MSERYGVCRLCMGQGGFLNGDDCGRCCATGFSGDAMDYVDKQNALRMKRGHVKEASNTTKEAYRHAIKTFLLYSSTKRIHRPSS